MVGGSCIDVENMQVQFQVRSHGRAWEYPGLTKVGEEGAGREATAGAERRGGRRGRNNEDDQRASRQVGRKV